MPLFRKKPVVVEAVQFDGSSTSIVAIRKWISGKIYAKPSVATRDRRSMLIHTLEGIMEVRPGDWVIKGIEGEFYPCKPDIFDKTYEPVEMRD